MDSHMQLELENIELDLLLEGIYRKYGYDFRNYLKSHIKRRILYRVQQERLDNITQLTEKILYNKAIFDQILFDLSINVTEMFRYPPFFQDIRNYIVPILKTYPSIKIWHAGCSTGEEVLSMAILLKEEGLLNRAKIYATDINKRVLDIAAKGIYPINQIKNWTKNYHEAGGKKSFTDYYTANLDSVIMDQDLLENVTFLEHNLTQDQSFISANLIICRNVLIYFDKDLKKRVVDLFEESLVPGGILGIGSKENLDYMNVSNNFIKITKDTRIYKVNFGEDYEA